MEVTEAIDRVFEFFQRVFQKELAGGEIINLRLEEVELDDSTGNWFVTLGFSLKEDQEPLMIAHALGQPRRASRRYKVIRVNGSDGAVTSMKMRGAE